MVNIKNKTSVLLVNINVILLAFRDITVFDIKIIDISIVLTFLLGILYLLGTKRSGFNVFNFTSLFIYLFLFYICLSILWTTDFQSGILGVLKVFVVIALVTLTYIIVTSEKDIIKVLKVWVISCAISSVINLVLANYSQLSLNLFSDIQVFYSFKRNFSNFYTDGNNFAIYLIMSLVIVEFLKSKQKENVTKLNLISIPIILNWILSLSRTGWIIGVICYGIIKLINYRDNFRKINVKFLIYGLVLIVTSIGILLALIYMPNLEQIFFSNYSTNARLHLWTTAFHIFLDHFFTGTGIGGYQFTAITNYASSYILLNPYAHNIFLKILATLGFIGLSLFVTIFITMYSSLKDTKLVYRTPLMILFVGVIAFLLQNLTVSFLTSRFFWLFLVLLNMYISIINRSSKSTSDHSNYIQ